MLDQENEKINSRKSFFSPQKQEERKKERTKVKDIL
jgi:hypothetical protein